MAAEVPSETMFDILSRMPVKSLARFRCVSKQWCNYISDPYLETMHAKRAIVNDPILIMFHQFPSDHPNSPCTLSYLEYNEEPFKVKPKPSVMEFMCKDSRFRYPDDIILGSCNGLLYSSQRQHDSTTYVVFHPLRRELYEVPLMNKSVAHPQPDPEESYLCVSVEETCGLGFDESTNTFKMVSVVLREHVWTPNCYKVNEVPYTMVHVLGTDSWRKINQVPCYSITGESVFANGCLHWLISNESNYDHRNHLGRRVVSFDVANEEFGLMDAPRKKSLGKVKEQLVDLDGEVGYVYHIVDRGTMELWVLKERGWEMHCRFEEKWPLSYGFIKVLGFWNEYGDVLMADHSRKKLFVYDLYDDWCYEVSIVGWEEKAAIDFRMYQISFSSIRSWIKN